MSNNFERPRRWAVALLITGLVLATAAPASLAAAPPRTLADILARLDRHPGLRSADEAVLAAESLRRQAAAWPNPTIDFERESLSPPESFEWTLGVTQPLEWPGLRSARSGAARERVAAETFRREAVRRDIAWELAREFARLAFLEARMTVAESLGTTLRHASRIGGARHAAGDLADLDLIRLESERVRHDVERGRLTAEIDAARRWLAGLVDWPVDSLAAGVDPGALSDRDPVGGGGSTTAAPAAEAMALRHEAASAEARERVLGRALLPRPVVGVGYRRARGDDAAAADGTTLSIGAEVPLWNRNGGERDAVRAEARRYHAEADLAERRRTIEREAALRTAAVLDSQVVRLDTLIEQRGSRLLEAADTGWREGEFSWLEWRDATRSWAELLELRATLLHDRFLNRTRARLLAGGSPEGFR